MANDIGTAVPCPVIPQKASNQRKNQKYELVDLLMPLLPRGRSSSGEKGLTTMERYVFEGLLRGSSDTWRSNPYQSAVLENNGLTHAEILTNWGYSEELANRYGCGAKNIEKAIASLEQRGLLRKFYKAGGLALHMPRDKRPNLFVFDLAALRRMAYELMAGEGTTVPPPLESGTTVPGEGTTVPGEGTTVPGEGTTVPTYSFSSSTSSLSRFESEFEEEKRKILSEMNAEQGSFQLVDAVREIVKAPMSEAELAKITAFLESEEASPEQVTAFNPWWHENQKRDSVVSVKTIYKWWGTFKDVTTQQATATARPLCGHCINGWKIPVEEGALLRCLCAGGKPLTDTEPAGQPSATLEEPVSLEEQTANTQTISALVNQLKTGRQ
jgi:hypothetical protein